eukprot:TRINITY_DN1128_c1_g1_i3.p1 TRINITY_DN1128_c1_g1~~TRINITY_DN1128_c1_g1_i3.p1  ORF type:complete len:342 (-),score=89.87 TRINITY_DN1128_c1_g1_i3:68-1093(-)
MSANQADRALIWNHTNVGNSIQSAVLKGPSINGQPGERVRVKIMPIAAEEEPENIEYVVQEACDNNAEVFTSDDVIISKDEVIVESGELKEKQVIIERLPYFEQGEAVRITTEQVLADHLPQNLEGPVHDLRTVSPHTPPEPEEVPPVLFEDAFAARDGLPTLTLRQERHITGASLEHTAAAGANGINQVVISGQNIEREGLDLREVRKRVKQEQAHLDQHVDSLQQHLVSAATRGSNALSIHRQVVAMSDRSVDKRSATLTTTTTTTTTSTTPGGSASTEGNSSASASLAEDKLAEHSNSNNNSHNNHSSNNDNDDASNDPTNTTTTTTRNSEGVPNASA